MNAIALAVACTMGIDVGWQPVEDGPGVEYILQLDAESLEVLQGGEMFVSDIPAQVKDVRRLQISFGSRKLPRRLPKPISPPPVAKSPGEPGRFTPEDGSQPIVPPADSGTQLVAGAEPATGKAGKSGEASKRLAAESGSSLDALMNTKGTSGSETRSSAEPLPLAEGTAERPWVPLVGAVLGLFGSLGANVFLGWLWFGERTRYRKALARMAPREG